MAFIRSDIMLYGKHGNILRSLTENGIFTSGADGFVKSALVGIYHGKKSEPENTQENKIEISRTYFDKRQSTEDILFTFLQHEKVYQKKPLKATEVFLYDESPDDDNQLIDELKEYALYGLEVLSDYYQSVLATTSTETVIQEIIDNELFTNEQLQNQVIEDEKDLFYKSFDDKGLSDELNEIMSSYNEG